MLLVMVTGINTCRTTVLVLLTSKIKLSHRQIIQRTLQNISTILITMIIATGFNCFRKETILIPTLQEDWLSLTMLTTKSSLITISSVKTQVMLMITSSRSELRVWQIQPFQWRKSLPWSTTSARTKLLRSMAGQIIK